MVLVTKIFLYGFITVITLIGVTNIFNTITSNMELRQKEFANLKSIGMTKKEFNRMINLETILYGFKAWIYGTIMGLIGTYAMYQAASIKKISEMYIPINAILISAVFVFIFVFIIMRYSIKKINKQNIIETIRKDNI
ncbi:MAG: FtsX-like permease family protein [Clostridia bacterium]|nr:FtsX-like permease family protein [Clostridia bacterium]